MPIPQSILDRIDLFDRNEADYTSPDYKEARLRLEFLDPLFTALGWDVNNTQGNAEAYKDVVYEDAIKIGGETKAPDYSFRIGGNRKFFVEAKKPSVDLKSDPEPARQLRRYSWSAKLPLGIVTDFHEFAIYDTRIRPAANDKASVARFFYCTYKELPEKWDEIAAIFSKDAILKGSFDKYASSSRGKRGTTAFDNDFLKDMERWRELLARNLALRNNDLSERDLNFAVQRILDRVVFLRIAEDRGIEPYGQLQALTAGPHIYPRLREIFERADFRYNSGLFHFSTEKGREESPDKLTLGLELDDATLKEILSDLYWPKSPYAFAVIPADILGHVYEQFLGKVIHLTDGHRAKVEEKPEVRKAGGVYYTPTYIVDYIVKQTVGPLVDGKTPKQVEKLTVLDPACGSGSFLLGAFEFLLAWHLDYYAKNDPEKWAKQKPARIYETNPNARFVVERAVPRAFSDAATSEVERAVPRAFSDAPQASAQGTARSTPLRNWQLTTAERKRILTANLYGVDIDAQAVEVTKLSLLLKVLEGEAREFRGKQMDFHRVLPDLGHNIKCGNSLIGSDFYSQPDLPAFDEEARYKLNVFDWDQEFAVIMKSGGFDAVIGNPPYGATLSSEETQYCIARYSEAAKYPDSYCLFIIRIARLVRHNGRLSLIVPNTFCDLETCDSFRRWLMTDLSIERIWQSGWAFDQAVVDTLVFVAEKSGPMPTHSVMVEFLTHRYERPIAEFFENNLLKIDYRNSSVARSFVRRISSASRPFGDFATIKAGVKMYERGKGSPPQTPETLEERPYSTRNQQPKDWRVLYRGEDVTRYSLAKAKEWVNYGPWLAAPREPELFTGPKLLMRRTDDRLMVALDHLDAIAVNSCHVIKVHDGGPSPFFFVGVLNSSTVQRIFELQNPQMVGKTFAEIKVIYVERLPIPRLDLTKKPDRAAHDTLVTHVERMLKLHEDLAAAKSPDAQSRLQREIAATDRAIDQLVYQLYALTPEEIALVEAATAPVVKASDDDAPATPEPTAVGYTQAEVDAAHHYSVQEEPPK